MVGRCLEIDKYENIIIKSKTLFSKNGFEGTSLNDIAHAVGIRKSTIYSHFSSKDEIFLSIFKHVCQQFSLFLKNSFIEIMPLTVEDRLRTFLMLSLEKNKVLDINSLFWKRARLFPPEHLKANMDEEIYSSLVLLWRELENTFQEGMDQGSIKNGNVRQFTEAYYFMMDGLIFSLFYMGGHDFKERAEVSWQIFRDGMFIPTNMMGREKGSFE